MAETRQRITCPASVRGPLKLTCPPPTQEVEVSIIEDNDSAASIQRMARENNARKQGGMATVISDVRATVEALAKGLIPESKMPAPSTKTNAQHIRYAPSFISGASCPSEGQHPPYTANTVARFLGMVKKLNKGKEAKGEADDAVVTALAALELIEQGALTEDAAIDLTTQKELGPEVLAQKIQAKSEAIEAAARRQRDVQAAFLRSSTSRHFDQRPKAMSARATHC